MSKFILLYNGPATPMDQIDPEKGKEIMQAWGNWMEKVGDKMVDIGQPMEPKGSVSVVDDGSEKEAPSLSGYSIVSASNMDEAKSLVADHPFLSDKTGNFSVDVYELLPVPEM